MGKTLALPSADCSFETTFSRRRRGMGCWAEVNFKPYKCCHKFRLMAIRICSSSSSKKRVVSAARRSELKRDRWMLHAALGRRRRRNDVSQGTLLLFKGIECCLRFYCLKWVWSNIAGALFAFLPAEREATMWISFVAFFCFAGSKVYDLAACSYIWECSYLFPRKKRETQGG